MPVGYPVPVSFFKRTGRENVGKMYNFNNPEGMFPGTCAAKSQPPRIKVPKTGFSKAVELFSCCRFGPVTGFRHAMKNVDYLASTIHIHETSRAALSIDDLFDAAVRIQLLERSITMTFSDNTIRMKFLTIRRLREFLDVPHY